MQPIAKFLALPLLTLCAACSTVTVNRQDVNCLGFIPDSWQKPVPSAPIPTQGSTDLEEAKVWAGGFVAQSGQLAKANGKFDDTVHIIGECERRYNAAVPRKKFLGVF
jgi:hypothetical protein